MPPTNAGRRLALTQAAVSLLADQGAHGLTHRAVERRAGVPAGTASNYFRTREALLLAAAEHVVALHLADMVAAVQDDTAASDGEDVVERLVAMIAASLHAAATTHRERYLAIVELQLEAGRRPALAAALAGLGEASLALTGDLHDALGTHARPESIATLVTLYGGVLFPLVTAPVDQVDGTWVRTLADAIVRGALTP